MAVARKVLSPGRVLRVAARDQAAAGRAHVKLVCLPAEAELINAEGTRVRMPVQGPRRAGRDRFARAAGQAVRRRSAGRRSRRLRSRRARDAGAAVSLARRARAAATRWPRRRVPCMSIMNMPPLPYLARIPGPRRRRAARLLHRSDGVGRLRSRADDAVQPRPAGVPSAGGKGQRAAGEPADQLQGRRGSTRTRTRRCCASCEADIEAARFDTGGGTIELPVKLKVHDRCSCRSPSGHAADRQLSLRPAGRACARSRRRSTPTSSSRARSTNGCASCAVALGAAGSDLVPFEKYADAARRRLRSPSSAARALAAGAPNIERVDLLVQAIAAQKGMRSDADRRGRRRTVDRWIARNRSQSAAPVTR